MSGPIRPPLRVEEEDGSPSVRPVNTIKVTDGTLTDDGGATVTIDTSGSGGSPATPAKAIQFNSDPAGTFTGSSRLLFDTDSNAGRIEMSSGLAATQPEIRTMTGRGLQISSTDTDESIRNQIIVFGEADGPDGIALYPATGLYISVGDSTSTPAQITTRGASANLVLTTNLTEDKAKITLNAGSNGDVDIQTEGTGITEIQNATTDNDTTLSVKGNGTGDAIINLNNPTKAISLICDTNQKLKVQGGVNTFVFDASSAAGGITWPDGTIQTTAASGGGDFNVILLEDVINSGYVRYPISSQAPYGSTSVTVATYSASTTFDQPYAFPFIAPESGDVSELGVEISSAAGSSCNLEVGIYSTASTGAPDSLLGKAVFDITTTGYKYDTSLSATVTLVKSTQYWIMFVRDTSAVSYGVRAVQQAFGTPTICPVDSPNPNGSCKQIRLANSDNTLPASSITLNDFFPASENAPCISLKIS